MNQTTQQQIIGDLITNGKKRIFEKEAQATATDAEVLGIMMSQHLEWDVDAVVEMSVEAMGDSNMHGFAAFVRAAYEAYADSGYATLPTLAETT